MATEKRITRLISADALIEHLERCMNTSDGIIRSVCVAVKCCVEMMPKVEVVHGYWISLTDCANAGVYCSVCHKKVWKEDYAWCNRKNKLRSNYCPNCGAKMDGGKENG